MLACALCRAKVHIKEHLHLCVDLIMPHDTHVYQIKLVRSVFSFCLPSFRVTAIWSTGVAQHGYTCGSNMAAVCGVLMYHLKHK